MKQRKPPELKPLFVERMKDLLGKEYSEYEKILKIPPVRSIRCNTIKISPEELKKKLEKKGWKTLQPWKDYPEVMIVEGKNKNVTPSQTLSRLSTKNTINEKKDLYNNKILAKDSSEAESKTKKLGATTSLINLEPGELGRALEHLIGYYYIQELASMLPIIALKPEPNQTVLDLCSAPGSKTTQASAKMQNTGTIIANELSLGRIKILASNLERCGVSNTIITKKEGSALCKRLANQDFKFSKILIDAPCSGEGTLRSSYKTYLMWNIKTIKNLPKIQKNLVASAIPILKTGGEFIYSTCTHAPEENEGVVDSILKEFPNIEIQPINLPIKSKPGITKWQDQEYSQEVKKCARVYPQDNNTEGFFLAKFKKVKE